ncbi:MAG: patatin-like phospholipase family protein [Polyangiales bacterium]
MSRPTLRQWLAEAPFGLALSSGFFGFFAHTGFVQVLEREGLAPSAVSGSSAGALVGGLWAAGARVSDLAPVLLGLRREDFWDARPGLGLLAGRRFRRLLRELSPVRRIEEAPTTLRVSTFDVLARTAIVHATGDFADVVRASCAVPLMFHPVALEGRPHLDGGIADRPGILGVAAMPRVLHHHLPSRSPWRFRVPGARGAGVAIVSIAGLPRVDPFRLERGRLALEAARDGFSRALDAPLVLADAVAR